MNASIQTKFYESAFFNFSYRHRIQTLKISMKCHTNNLTTQQLPLTTKILKQNLPSVLLTSCFNSEGLSFQKEVKKTEIAHLFEHLLLEYLCLEKITQGHSSASFSGRTHWNWIKFPRGSFFISITIEKTDLKFLPQSLSKSVVLLEKILSSAI